MSDAMPLIKVFRRELLEFLVPFTGIGNATFGVREGLTTIWCWPWHWPSMGWTRGEK